jgi:hypothetical protein
VNRGLVATRRSCGLQKNHSRVGVAEKKNKTKNTYCSSFCKKNTLIDVDCTQKSSCWLQLGCRFWVATWLQNNLWLVIFSPQDATMLDVFVPRARQEFDSIEAAHQFFLDYAKMAGFSVRTMRTSKETKHWVCNCQGFMKLGKENEEPQTDKRSMRIGCPAYAKVKEDKNAKPGTSTESGKHTTINFNRQPGWLDICMLISRRKLLWITCLQSCQGVACQTRLR